MDNLEQKVFKLKTELVYRGYLTGWEIKHYTNLLKDLEERLKNVRNAFIPTQ